MSLQLEDLKKYLERIGVGLVRVEVRELSMPSSGWYTVSFTQAFKEKPFVVAITEGAGSLQLPSVDIPKVTLPRLSLPGLPKLNIPYIALPTWSRIDFTSRAEDLKQAFIKVAGDWGLLNWLRDRFADIFYWIGRAVGELLNWYWDRFIKPNAEMLNNFSTTLQNEVNKALATVEGYFNNAMYRIQQAVNEANTKIEEYESTLNAKLKEMQGNINSAVSTLSQHAFTITPVRNITVTGVDVYCPANVKVRVIAIGRA